MEQELQDFRERILAATKDKPLRIRGGGTKDWYGREPRGELLDTRAWRGVVSYEPTELVITVKSGTPLTEVEAVLAAQNQMLAFEPPHFGAGATVGGMVAAGLSGPSRQAVGAVRDFVLGAVLMDAKGEVLHFGGQVMKNVAGYDVSRLLAGSLGTLGLILEVSLKVLPRPFEETTLRFDLAEGDAIRKLNEWGGQPLPISASVWHAGMLAVRLSGAAAALQGARSRMGGEEAHDDTLWQDLREQRHAFFAAGNGQPLWRLSVPTVAKPLGLPGKTLIEWGGAQRWLHADAADAATMRSVAAKAGGHATLFRGGARDDVFHPLQPAVATIHRRLKNAFDPAGIFNPGRMLQDD